nr:sugar phosphate isomerase/epimerase family protein [Candidatus Sigynarchaeum springense]MDO8118684.1 sugar phosphate isomerase/epimerase family protein [Candidatus Sigynarchaeota archaeon]
MKINISCAWLYAISKYEYVNKIEAIYSAIKDMARLNYKAIELETIRDENMNVQIENKKKLKDLIDSLNLKVIDLCAVNEALVRPNWEKNLDFFKKSAELAVFLGSPMIQLDSFVPPLKFCGEAPYKDSIKFGLSMKVEVDPAFQWERHWKILVDSVKACDKIAQDHGLKLCMEPRVGETVANSDAILRLMDWVNSDNFGAVLDTGHLNGGKEVIPVSAEKLNKKIFYVHASDNDGKDNRHLGLGKGNIDWEGLLRVLKKYKYNGYIAMDIGNIPNLDEENIRSIKFLEDIASRI